MQNIRETLPIGSVVDGRYQIEQLLGRGGFGAVYLVSDQQARQNLFALKEVIDTDKRERARFTFEAELLKRIDHPALPHVYHVFEDDVHDRAYMLMNYVEGPNLEKLRAQQPGKQFSVVQVLTIMGPIMDAVSYLHERHPPIIHRDIKPSNIIVPNSGEGTVLVDFGIAKFFDPDATTTAIRHASPGYGAPEQYATGTNTRTDIYGLGATMYALLTGIVPKDSFFRITQFSSRGSDPLEPIQRFAPGVPYHVSNAIYRAMAIDIENRFPTVQEFKNALNSLPPMQHQSPLMATPLVEAGLAGTAFRDGPPPTSRNDSMVAMPGRRDDSRRKANRGLLLLLTLLVVLLLGVAAADLLLPAFLNHHPGPSTPAPAATVQHKPTATVAPHPTVTPGLSPTTASPPSASDPTPSPTPSLTPSPTPSVTPSPTPTLGTTYHGSIHNTPANSSATMSLTSIKQNGGAFQGNFNVNLPLSGSGPFTGTVNNARSVQFTVHSSQVPAPLFFQGNLNSDGSLSGTYCSLDQTGHCNPAAGGYGTWQVSPASF
ncbi:MAG TPA: protein kinase [Ktedonobacteraceae bacterium]|nr:protein kinase [Ktedonobacteraceae bacterium]